MNLAKTIEELPGGAPIYIDNYETLEVAKFCHTDDLKRLVATLRKCETAIESRWLPVSEIDELLSEIREVLDGKGN